MMKKAALFEEYEKRMLDEKIEMYNHKRVVLEDDDDDKSQIVDENEEVDTSDPHIWDWCIAVETFKEDEEEDKKHCCRNTRRKKKRSAFERQAEIRQNKSFLMGELRSVGLVIDDSNNNEKGTKNFVLIAAPPKLQRETAEKMRLRMPLKVCF